MSSWTDEKVELLRTLRREGHSFGEISKRLKMSRNSCIGKAARLGLPTIAAAKRVRGKPGPKILLWNEPDKRDPEHAIDTRDLAILDACMTGRSPAAIAREFKTTESLVRELWRVRELQEPVGEHA